MTFDDIKSGSAVYVDANIFVYNFTGRSDECQLLLNRCEQMDLRGATGMHVVLEVAHRLMMMEAVSRGLVSGRNIPARLKRRPESVGMLIDPRRWIESIKNSDITILEPSLPTLESSLYFQQRYGLLVNDSVSAALMDEHGITTIATNDRDFARIPEFSVHTPSDV